MTIYEQLEKELRLRNYSYNTIQNYSSCLKTLISKCGENPSVEVLKNFLLTVDNSNYHKQFTAVIHHYFKLILKKPLSLEDIPYPRKEARLPDVLSIQEVSSLLSVCDNIKHKAIISLLYGCGLRISEAINMKPEHVDSKRMVIKIVQGKGKKDRYVKLPQELLELLREYHKKYRPKTYLFNGQDSIQYSRRSIGQLLEDLGNKAKIKKHIYPHLLRHSYAVHLLEAGTDIHLIQEALGHSNVKTTKIYARVSKAVISKMQSPLSFVC